MAKRNSNNETSKSWKNEGSLRKLIGRAKKTNVLLLPEKRSERKKFEVALNIKHVSFCIKCMLPYLLIFNTPQVSRIVYQIMNSFCIQSMALLAHVKFIGWKDIYIKFAEKTSMKSKSDFYRLNISSSHVAKTIFPNVSLNSSTNLLVKRKCIHGTPLL